ncbi:MAG: T9SS type A sorting domain-containing protein [Muribaculaceae bacterium]|nr:T9SS type A sorting domain-containing protein [Muribaculaceae bacterium]
MRGAFEYAVKIWEENLPECLPISIHISCNELPDNVPSKVGFRTLSFNQSCNADYLYPISAVKSVLLREYNRKAFQRFHQELPDVTILQREDDITITYNSRMFEDFSFSLDENDINGRFDFVSLALRDIARGLGVAPLFFADTFGGTLEKEDEPSTPYTEKLYYELGADSKIAYKKATGGNFKAYFNGMNFTYYAPSSWIDGLSMSTFIPEAGKPLSRVLSHNFGRGVVMRNLTGQLWTDTFRLLLDWRNDIITGPVQGSILQGGSTGNLIPFNGSFTIGGNDDNNADNMKMISASLGNPLEYSTSNKIKRTLDSNEYEPGYCFPYSFWISGLKGEATTVAALLKDGTWDILFSNYSDKGPEDLGYEPQEPISISTDDLVHHHDIESYARTVSGGLRYRIASGVKRYNYLRNQTYYDYDVTYYTREYTPQAARIRYSGYYMPAESIKANTPRRGKRLSSSNLDEDDEFIDVPIGISNVEGTDFIDVIQYDPGEDLPFTYVIDDFRKGYFMANIFREGTTRLYVVSYNQNGSTRSNTIEISGVGFPDRQIAMHRDGNNVMFTGIDRVSASGEMLCNLIDAATGLTVMSQILQSEENLSLENLGKGVYLVNLSDGKDKSSIFKVVK